MPISKTLDVMHKLKKSLLPLSMLTSIVAAALTTTCFANIVTAQDAPIIDSNQQSITYCKDGNDRTIGRRLLFVSTLDGRLSALDIAKGGKLHWSIPTGPGPLVSSSIHQLELTNNGQFVRMIPSLSGSIYKFDGDSIDPIPITTENLLSSSAKFSEDLVISGGKETRTYGISARTGQLLYECSMNGCVNSTDRFENSTVREEDAENTSYEKQHDPLMDDVVIVRRQTQTVRAVESRSGIERWNFSVGQHEVDLLKASECHDRDFSDIDIAILDMEFKVVVPEGIICAFSKAEPNALLWKYKFDHPIVSSWKLGVTDDVEPLDIFSAAQWVWSDDENMFDPPHPSNGPSIYLGMYGRQLYIQESLSIRKELDEQYNLYNHLTTDSALPKIPWRPIPANSNSLVVLHENKNVITGSVLPNEGRPAGAGSEGSEGNELVPYDDEQFSISAQSILNASEYVNGNGFFLYTADDLEKRKPLCENTIPAIEAPPATVNCSNQTLPGDELEFNLDDIDEPVKVVILSLWFWWKEIIMIAFTTAVVSLFIGHRQRPEREVVVIERHIPVPTAYEATESSTVALLGHPNNFLTKSNYIVLSNNTRSLSESTSHSGENYSSRFQGDFDLTSCLGRGGFGVVFEVKNKLDDCRYAVKRITLPNKKESRERVMREVKTLATCEHQNIVRFFQAWVENPPPGWQEEEDLKWLSGEVSTSIQIETPDETTLPSFSNNRAMPYSRRVKAIARDKRIEMWTTNEQSSACSSNFEHINGDNGDDHYSEDDDDDSIVFRTESQSRDLKENDTNGRDCKVFGSQYKRMRNEAVSIDIHSDSLDLSGSHNGRGIDYSQLSNAFQIEYVRSANGDAFGSDGDGLQNGVGKWPNGKRKSRAMSLELTNNNNREMSKCLALPGYSSDVSKSLPKIQHKVYLYIQMQLCRKESLRDWLRENRREARQGHIVNIFHQILDGVEYVHLKGLIHRDLKPSNIFFSQDGKIKIGDFGLVTDMSENPNNGDESNFNAELAKGPRHTQQVGTHLYMSPEQQRGLHYNYKVDIYSLGLIFFELLVFFGTEMERIETLRGLRNGRYPTKFSEEFPSEFDILQLMLSAQPELRPDTVDLKTQLNSILHWQEILGTDANGTSSTKRLSECLFE